MDFVYLLLAAALFAVTWWLISGCESLRGK